ncbi:hypothetical protein [Bradyrhizobium sp.]|uniref:hypothetical protein n=1 Tax=Bradyrhizobium sp. TaxID=376 RepID=UPI0039E627A1
MPYQVKAGSFLVVAPTLAAAIRLHDDMKNNPDGVSVRDMEGAEIDVERIRPILNDGEPN